MANANNTLCACGCQQVVLTVGRGSAWRRGHYAKVHPTPHTRRLLPQTPEERRAKDIDYSHAYRAANPEKVAATQCAYRMANKAEAAARDHAYHLAHTEESAAYNRAYYLANKATIAASVRAYSDSHKAEIAARGRAYRVAHPEVGATHRARRRARKAGAAINDLTAAQWREILAAYGHRCVYCGRKMQRLTQDHIVPLANGGTHTFSNIVPACRSCNSKKGTKAPLVPVQPLLLTISASRSA